MDFAAHRDRCPITCGVLDAVPRKYGHAFFSSAAPQTHITAHNGPTSKKLRCHLPLVCPDDGSCRLRVGDETVEMAESKAVIFDDSFNHEAWNDHADRARIVLIFDVWRGVRRYSVEASRGAAAAEMWIFRGDGSRRRRGCDADIPWRRVAVTPRLRRGHSVETGRGDAGDRTRIFRGRIAATPQIGRFAGAERRRFQRRCGIRTFRRER